MAGDTMYAMGGLHGEATDNPILSGLLNAGSYMRYGMPEAQHIEELNRLSVPGVRDVAYGGPAGTFDPAAAERYSSAYRFGQMWNVPQFIQSPLISGISRIRSGLSSIGFPGVGPERPELASAMQLGMQRGAETNPSWSQILSGYGWR